MRVVYYSKVSAGVRSADIERLIAGARRRNRQLDITGALMVWEGFFVQVVEGRLEAVEETMQRIAKDKRHEGLRILAKEHVQRRLFADWDMGLAFDTDGAEGLKGLRGGHPSAEAVMTDIHRLMSSVRESPFR